MWACLNGAVIPQEEAVRAAKRLFPAASDSLLETMRWEHGVCALRTYHWQRLFTSMDVLGIFYPATFNAAFLDTAISNLLDLNDKKAGSRVRLQVAAASGPAVPPHFLLTCADLPVTGMGVRAGIAAGVFKTRHPLSHLKTGSRQLYDAASKEAAQNGWDEALLCNEAGRIMESTIANIFWVKKGAIFTPPLSEGCVAGAMRAYLLDNLPAMNFQISETPLTLQTLQHADEIFLANAVRGLRPVLQLAASGKYSSYLCGKIQIKY